MKHAMFTLITMLFWSSASISGAAASPASSTHILASRSGDTCADPSSTVTFLQAFDIGFAAYAMAAVARYTSSVAADPTGGTVYQGDVFLGWATQDPQNFTTPFYRLFNPTTTDWLFEISTDANPPSAPGFTVQGIIGYVYSTPVCGSVPLFGAFNAAAGTHYYTTNVNDHALLITLAGWVDAGIAGYVLPLSAAW